MKSKRLYKGIIFFGISFSIFLLLFSLYSLKINRIVLTGVTSLYGLESLYRVNSLFLDKEKIKKDLININPSVQSINIDYIFPNTLNILATENKKIAFIENNDLFLIVGENSRIIGKSKDKPNLSEIYIEQMNLESYNIGQYLPSDDIRKAISIIKSIKRIDNSIRVDILGNSVILCNLEDKKILFGGKRDINEEIYDAMFMLESLKREGTEYKTLDIRFTKPVVSINNYESSYTYSN